MIGMHGVIQDVKTKEYLIRIPDFNATINARRPENRTFTTRLKHNDIIETNTAMEIEKIVAIITEAANGKTISSGGMG